MGSIAAAQPSGVPQPWRDRATEGLVRVREYTCTACRGERPQVEQFACSSVSVVRSGAFAVRSERQPRLLASGFLLLGNAGQDYETLHEHGGGDRCLVFELGDGVVEELAESRRRGLGRRPFATNVLPPLPRAAALWRLAERRLAAAEPGAAALGLEELGLALAELAVDVAGRGTARPHARARDDRRERERILAAVAHIEQAAGDAGLGLRGLAAVAGTSPFHFLRLFKRETGATPYRYLRRARLERAIQLLLDTERPITEIAFDVGFGDLSNFINAFRREVGCSPRQYRGQRPQAARPLARRPGRSRRPRSL